MNEMELLARFRDQVPADLPLAGAEDTVLTAIRGGSTPAARRSWGRWRAARPLLAAGLAAALAAGTYAAIAVSGPAGPGTGITVRELAYRTAAAAAAQPPVRPGQWIYWKEKTLDWKAGRVFQVWTTADSGKAAYVYRGKVHFIGMPAVPVIRNGKVVRRHGRPVMRKAGGSFIGQPEVFVLPHGQGVTIGSGTGTVPVSYAALRSLPRDPQALLRYLGSLPLHGWGPAPVRQFEVIKEMLTTYVMPPALTAELYRALGDIRGVTASTDAADVDGRPGAAFRIAIPPWAGGQIDEIVINPRTFQLMGTGMVATAPARDRGKVLGGTAILRMAFVPAPGVFPNASR